MFTGATPPSPYRSALAIPQSSPHALRYRPTAIIKRVSAPNGIKKTPLGANMAVFAPNGLKIIPLGAPKEGC
jgi:hypothetical protein